MPKRIKPESWNELNPTDIVSVELVPSATKYNVPYTPDKRKRINRFVFSVTYESVEFRRTVATKRHVELTMPHKEYMTKREFELRFDKNPSLKV
jgi:hypothetical protein